MDRTLGKAGDQAIVGERNVRDRGIVGKHRDHHLAVTSPSNIASLVRTQLYQRAASTGAAVEYGNVVSGRHQVARHGRAHMAQSNESSLHVEISLGAGCQDRAGGAMNSGPMGSTIAALRIRSIFAWVVASSDQPCTPSAACT